MNHSVIHLIPNFGIGGVERAAMSMVDLEVSTDANIDFKVRTIFNQDVRLSRYALWNPFHYLVSALQISKDNPNLLVVSLWRSCIVAILVKIFRPKMRIVLFLHLATESHIVDKLLHRIIFLISHDVWADSFVTLKSRLPKLPKNKGVIISFVTERIDTLEQKPALPRFVFWGRLHSQKNIAYALQLFKKILDQKTDATFLIIGPDDGELDFLQGMARKLDIAQSVKFLGPMDFEQIRSVADMSSFYLQTSNTEGMAVSVVEAMQLGLVPVVTPAGEIIRYAENERNAILVESERKAISGVLSLLCDEQKYQAIRKRAIATWKDAPLYRESVLEASRNALGLASR